AAIKAAGGITIVQDPADAQAPAMPLAAISQSEPDHCVPLPEIPRLLASLVHQPSEKGVPMSPDQPPQPPTGFTCPECHGTIWEVHEANEVHYECRVGHTFSAESFSESHDDALERALWAAVRSLEESAAVGHRLAGLARERSRERAVALYE